MSHFRKRTKVFLTAALAALALSVLVAASASAAIVPAKFSSSSLKLTTSGITVKKNGAEAKTCTPALTLEGYYDGWRAWIGNQQGGEAKFHCPNNVTYLTMAMLAEPKYDTVSGAYSLKFSGCCGSSMMSPYGSYMPWSTGYTGAWANGSESAASTLSFNETLIGSTVSGSHKITISGTFDVTTPGGGLVTLSH